MKIITTTLFLLGMSGVCAQHSMKGLAGTWQTVHFTVSLSGGESEIEIAKDEFQEKLGFAANVGEYHGDSTYEDGYYQQENELLGKTSGTWYVSGDSFTVVQDGGATYSYHLEVKNDTGRFTGFIDYDQDGEVDDLMTSTAVKIAGDMKTYYFVSLYKSTPEEEYTPQEAAEIQAAHLANIRKLAEEKKLLLAGPFMDQGDMRGIFILSVESQEEAEAFTAEDPAVKAGLLRMEVRPWWGPYELMGMLKE